MRDADDLAAPLWLPEMEAEYTLPESASEKTDPYTLGSLRDIFAETGAAQSIPIDWLVENVTDFTLDTPFSPDLILRLYAELNGKTDGYGNPVTNMCSESERWLATLVHHVIQSRRAANVTDPVALYGEGLTPVELATGLGRVSTLRGDLDKSGLRALWRRLGGESNKPLYLGALIAQTYAMAKGRVIRSISIVIAQTESRWITRLIWKAEALATEGRGPRAYTLKDGVSVQIGHSGEEHFLLTTETLTSHEHEWKLCKLSVLDHVLAPVALMRVLPNFADMMAETPDPVPVDTITTPADAATEEALTTLTA
jgi:hypothetical protein